MQKFEVHPVADIFPMMSDFEFENLKESIRNYGQRESITLWCGQLIDGRNRLKACNELGIAPDICELDEEYDPVQYVIDHNLHRRHLSESQRAMVAGRLAKLSNGQRKINHAVSFDTASLSDAAKKLNVGRATAARAKKVIAGGSDKLQKAVDDDVISVSLASKLVKQVPYKKEQDRLLKQGVDFIRDMLRDPKPEPSIVGPVESEACEEIEWEDVEDDEPCQASEDFKLREFKQFWATCSDVSKTAIRIWVNEQ